MDYPAYDLTSYTTVIGGRRLADDADVDFELSMLGRDYDLAVPPPPPPPLWNTWLA